MRKGSIATLVVTAVLIAPKVLALVLVNCAQIALLRTSMTHRTPGPLAVYDAPTVINDRETASAERLLRIVRPMCRRCAEEAEARLALLTGNYAKARRDFEAIAERTENPLDHALAGNASAFLGDKPRALPHWMAAARSVNEREQLADSLCSQVNTNAFRPERCRDAAALLESAQTDRIAARRMIVYYDTADDYAAALRIADRLLAEDPNDFATTDSRVWLLVRAGQGDRAIAAANAVIAKRPTRMAYMARGTIRLQRCDVTGGIQDLRAAAAQAASADSRQEWIRAQLAAALWEHGERGAALILWNGYLRDHPNDPKARDDFSRATAGTLLRRCGT